MVLLVLGLGTLMVFVSAYIGLMRPVPVRDWSDGCLACGSPHIRTEAPGVFHCDACGYEGGEGMPEYRWQQKVVALSQLSDTERRYRARQLCVDARRLLIAAEAEVDAAAKAFNALSGNNRDQRVDVAEGLIVSASQDLAEARSWLEEAGHLLQGSGRLPHDNNTEVVTSVGVRIADAQRQARDLWGVLRGIDPTEGRRSIKENLALVQDTSAPPVARADAFSALVQGGHVPEQQRKTLVLAALVGPPHLSRLAVKHLSEVRLDLTDALLGLVAQQPERDVAAVLGEALGSQPSLPAVEQALVVLLRRPETEVQLAAARSASKVGGDGLVEPLRPLADRPDSLGEAARIALGRLLQNDPGLAGAVMLAADSEQGALSLSRMPTERDAIDSVRTKRSKREDAQVDGAR